MSNTEFNNIRFGKKNEKNFNEMNVIKEIQEDSENIPQSI